MSYMDKVMPADSAETMYWGTVALGVYLSAFVIVTIVGFAFGYPDALWVWVVPFIAGFRWIFDVAAKFVGSSNDTKSAPSGDANE